jgi:hypothetical protein
MPTPLAHTHYKKLDLEIGWRLPLTKYLKDSLLDILVLHRRTLRALEPADYVLHLISLIPRMADRSQKSGFYHLGDTLVLGYKRFVEESLPKFGPSLGCGLRTIPGSLPNQGRTTPVLRAIWK